MFEYWYEGVIFIFIFLFIITIPCIGISIIGSRMINQLGRFPSKTPAIQLSIFFQFVLLMIITFTFLIVFYHFFSSG